MSDPPVNATRSKARREDRSAPARPRQRIRRIRAAADCRPTSPGPGQRAAQRGYHEGRIGTFGHGALATAPLPGILLRLADHSRWRHRKIKASDRQASTEVCRSARSTVGLARAASAPAVTARRRAGACDGLPSIPGVLNRGQRAANRTRAATVTAAGAESSLVRSTAEPTIGDPGPLPLPLEQGTLRRSPLRNGDHHPTFRVDKRPTGPQPG